MTFTEQYFMRTEVILIRNDTNYLKSLEQLNGQTLALKVGSSNIEYIKEKFPNIKQKLIEPMIDKCTEIVENKKKEIIKKSLNTLNLDYKTEIARTNLLANFSDDSKNKINMLRIPFISKLMSYVKSKNINRIRGCNYSIFKNDIVKVNGFNEEITTWGREDSEFVQRLFNIGLKKKYLKFGMAII